MDKDASGEFLGDESRGGMGDPEAASPAVAAPKPFKGAMLLSAGLILAAANFMAVLDTTIANVSVPLIAGGLAVSPSEGAWTITSYSVAEAITVALSGWLSARGAVLGPGGRPI